MKTVTGVQGMFPEQAAQSRQEIVAHMRKYPEHFGLGTYCTSVRDVDVCAPFDYLQGDLSIALQIIKWCTVAIVH